MMSPQNVGDIEWSMPKTETARKSVHVNDQMVLKSVRTARSLKTGRFQQWGSILKYILLYSRNQEPKIVFNIN